MDSILGSVFGPQNGVRFVGKIVVTERKTAQVSIVLHVRDRSFPYRWLSRALQRREYLFSTPLRTFMSTHVLELGRPSVATPVLLVISDPKMKATHSPENAI